jgi:Zn-dependent peptidase ImmA (M78 family)/transcriptional regulator with XRE-family HTH domain
MTIRGTAVRPPNSAMSRDLRPTANGDAAAPGESMPVAVLKPHVMAGGQQFHQQRLGQRIADARIEAELTQADLAAAIDVDRTAVAKIEAGSRGVSALELARIAAALGRPLDWFLVEGPPAVVSRRTDAATGQRSVPLDRAVEKVASDVEFLMEQGIFSPAATELRLEPPRDLPEAERAAGRVRAALQADGGPLLGLGEAAERLGVLCFALALGDRGGDGAYVSIGDAGVAVINGNTEAGRRRFTLAHEIGHHVFADEYATDLSVAEVGSEMERRINGFAVHLLLPRGSLTERWRMLSGEPREKAVRLGVEYRVSWSALCSQLKNLGLASEAEHQVLLARPPTRADYLELGMGFVEELHPPSVPRSYARAVLAGYRAGKLGANRTIDLLWGSITKEDLPELAALPIEAYQREFDPLP